LEIKDGKALINGSVDKETGHWCDTPVFKKLEDVKLSTDYTMYHEIRDNVDIMFIQPRNMLLNDPTLPKYASWGIHNEHVDDTCRMSFDMVHRKHMIFLRLGASTLSSQWCSRFMLMYFKVVRDVLTKKKLHFKLFSTTFSRT
jgi:hypothetical protein